MATLPLTYADLVCIEDLDPFASETTSDLQSLAQDVLHVLRELPGSNPDDPTRGVGVELYLSGTVAAFQTLPGIIEEQLRQDDRITNASATIAQNSDGSYTIKILMNVSNDVVPLEISVSAEGVALL